ncbi:hypothetical protein RhiirA4_468116 [Rhizophagus irregularis]|uniref:Protein kinase domain-containing protein n=1 Tax=Rhizophagus irregularis TaxID=588596 RepID=A0A2I1GXH7_9GLOM|nr:hypothetical protein RhiirA4_468116 [Rhizophagus irregularis]
MSVEKNIEENDQLINKYDAFGVFKILDYDLNLDERKLKFNRYDHVICEVCNKEIDKFNFICYNCYNKETDCNEQNRMNYGICKFCFKSNISYSCSDCKIFETLDYDLNLEERKAKYENYCYIFCEKCNKKINKQYYFCTDCYNKETLIIKKAHMKYGLNLRILNYNLNLKERRAMYRGNFILCENCFTEIDKINYYCARCYSKETIDINRKGRMRFGLNFGIFKTSDYNLNLQERRIKYKDFDGILCEKCNKHIDKWSYCCKYCYDKEADINMKSLMKFGPNFGIFKTSDYNLNLEERRIKYKDFDGILCEKCNKDIYIIEDCYCTSCYDKETDFAKKGHMEFGPNFRIFKTSDYNLDLEERRIKYKDFDGILCEKCNRYIAKSWNYCKHCYDKETDTNNKGFMKYGPNFIIFSTLDYHLSLEERKTKYKEYDRILCGKCINEIDRQYYNCEHCYNNQKINDKCKVCFIGYNDNCCSLYEFQQFLENFNKWISENKFIDNYLIREQKGEVPDYDLDEDDRLVKYKDFDYILCDKCDIKYHCNYCYDCYVKEINELNELKSELQPKLQDYENFYFKIYNKETKELKELKELQSILKNYEDVYFKLNSDSGIFKQIAQQFENTKCLIENRKTLINNIRYNGVNKCERKVRSYCDCYDKEIDIIKKKQIEFGKCKECLKIHEDLDGCLSCNSERFQRDFYKWTSRNEVIDKLIQDNQLSVKRYGLLLEWIPYDKFININYIAEGGFAKVYLALWIDGQIRKWSQLSNSWRRNGPTTVALKVLNNSNNISEDFLNEIKFLNEVSGYMCIIKCFGITQDPITNNYALVLQYMENGDLRKYLKRTANIITWDQRLNKIYDICLALNNIHAHGLIHKDLHPGNIFIGSTFAYIGDFGFCMPANEILSNSTKKNIYGVMPYMAPEILRGKPHTLASDVYSLGVIINEIITVIPPFNNQPHDHYLALDICRGLRPNIREETPTSLENLIKKCWDAIPENRPTSEEVFHTLSYHLNAYKSIPLKRLSYNFNESQVNETRPRLSYNLTNITDLFTKIQTHPQAIYTSRLLNFHKNLPEPINCPNQQEFISSRGIKKIQTGQVYTLHSDDCSDCIIMDID